MNHSSSFICWSLLSTDGWNSLSIHRLAAAESAQAWPQTSIAAANAADVGSNFFTFIVLLLDGGAVTRT